jgi:hypothetical protein
MRISCLAQMVYVGKVSFALSHADGLPWKLLYVSENYLLLVVIVLLIRVVPLCVESVFVMCSL